MSNFLGIDDSMLPSYSMAMLSPGNVMDSRQLSSSNFMAAGFCSVPASTRHVSGSDSRVPHGPSDELFGIINGTGSVSSPTALYDEAFAAGIDIKSEEKDSYDWPNMDFLDEPDAWNLPATNQEFDIIDCKQGIIDSVHQQPMQMNTMDVFGSQHEVPVLESGNGMIHNEFLENQSIDIADVLKEHEENLRGLAPKSPAGAVIPTTVLEMSRLGAGNRDTVVAVAHNCGASVNVNDGVDSGNREESAADQHFLLRKFLNDESYLANVRQSETMSAYEHISNVLLNATSSPRQSETILVDIKKEDYGSSCGVRSPPDYCQLGALGPETMSPYGTGSNFSGDDDHYAQSLSPAGSLSSAASSGLGKSPAYTQQTSPESTQTNEEDSLEPLVSIVMRQFKNEIARTCMQLHISSDPSLWSVEDVHKWIRMAVEHYNMPPVNLSKFMIDGSTFASLTEAEFKSRAPESGEELFATLYLWKTAQGQEQPTAVTASVVAPFFLSSGTSGVSSPVQPASNGSYTTLSTPSSEAGEATPNPPSMDASTSSMDCGDSDDDESGEPCEKPSTAAGASGTTRTGNAHIQLWQFLKELLADGQHYGACIRWLDRSSGVFKIEDSVRVARLWGRRKNRPAMNYDKLSRSIRQYYKKGIMKKTERSQRLVYQFCSPYYL